MRWWLRARTRLAVVDGVLAASVRTDIEPANRLQTVIDYSACKRTLAEPRMGDAFVFDFVMAASDRHMAQQILRGDGTGSNLTGIT